MVADIRHSEHKTKQCKCEAQSIHLSGPNICAAHQGRLALRLSDSKGV